VTARPEKPRAVERVAPKDRQHICGSARQVRSFPVQYAAFPYAISAAHFLIANTNKRIAVKGKNDF
jgi:hypothetical protein